MGLGKTIQVLSLLLVLKREAGGRRRASLLVAPASLLANWVAEIERFAPGLRTLVAHPSAMPAAELPTLDHAGALADVDLVITTYGSLLARPWLAEASVACRRARRGAGDQESRRQADPRREGS